MLIFKIDHLRTSNALKCDADYEIIAYRPYYGHAHIHPWVPALPLLGIFSKTLGIYWST